MNEIRLMPVDLATKVSEYFATTTDPDTVLCAPGIFPCVGVLAYRQGHLGLGHFDPIMEPVLRELAGTVMPLMQEEGTGDISCRLYTGMSFAARAEYQGENILRFIAYDRLINSLGFRYSGMNNSRTIVLANEGPALIIKEIRAQLTGDEREKVRVSIEYIDKDKSGEIYLPREEFEIDTITDETRVLQAFTGNSFYDRV